MRPDYCRSVFCKTHPFRFAFLMFAFSTLVDSPIAFTQQAGSTPQVPANAAPAIETSGDDAQNVIGSVREQAIKKWQPEINKLNEQNLAESHPEDSVLFIGSSSVRRWESISEDMFPYHAIRRGYGGARFSDLAVFAKELIQPHPYQALVVFVANDVTGKETDPTIEQIDAWVRYIVGVSHLHQPNTPVLIIEITPTESRFKAWAEIRKVNQQLREIALTTPHTYFIPTAEHFLTPEDTPRPELFVGDKLHLNDDGYDLWAKLIRRRLDDVLGDHKSHEDNAEGQ